MNILVVNCGSSSLKYQVFHVENGSFNLLAKGSAERIGIDGSEIKHSPVGKEGCVITAPLKDHKEAMLAIEPLLTDEKVGVLSSISEINGIGHRVVHGGEVFKASAIIDDAAIAAIDELSKFAPLHNPANLTGIYTCQQLIDAPNVAVFDTAVHQTMPAKAYMYGLPIEYYKEDGIRKYGFHGTSHEYVSREAAKVLGKAYEECRIITCHLGNGSSITAFENGKVVDTSMGLTPLEGLIMGTRSGDIDPAAVLSIMQNHNLSAGQMDAILNKKSGLLGLTGTSDLRDIVNMAEAGNAAAQLAVDMLIYRIQKYVGSYLAALNGADAIVFTAGIGENNPMIRSKVMQGLTFAGVVVDEAKNLAKEVVFSTTDSKIAALLIPTNEELMIAMDTYKLIISK